MDKIVHRENRYYGGSLMLKSPLTALFAAASLVCAAAPEFTIVPEPALEVRLGNDTVVAADNFRISGTPVAISAQRTETVAGDTVINSFGEQSGIPFRREVSVRDGGKEVEISFLARVPAYSEAAFGKLPDGTSKGVSYEVAIPVERFRKGRYTLITGRSSLTSERSGKGLPPREKVRWLLLQNDRESLIFDCDPRGVNAHGDYGPNGVIGMWQIRHEGDKLLLGIHYTPRLCGGDLCGKLVIHTGDRTAYDARHAHRGYRYFSVLEPERRFVFGAKKFGKDLISADTLDYTAERGFGWSRHGKLDVRTFAPEGAQYSAVASPEAAAFRTDRLRSGLYLVTVTAGNGTEKSVGPFAIACDGRKAIDAVTLAPHSVTEAVFPAWIESGSTTLEFTGSWQISTINLQLLQTGKEDYTFRRGFWRSTKGPYPSVMRHSEHYAEEPRYSTSVTSYPLPEQGKEMGAPRKAWKFPTLHAKFASPADDWRGGAVISSQGTSNGGTFQEFAEPALLERRMNELKNDNINAILLNGFLARHGFPRHLDRVEKAVADFVEAGHARGMKVLDHQDYSILWDSDSGFRVLIENLPKLQRTVIGGMPNRGLCPVNPAALAPYMKYIVKHVKNTGIDGIMVDETCFHGLEFCGCAACRKAFTAETGWHLPVNELSKDLNNSESVLWRTWLKWRQKKVGDFWYRLKSEVAPFRPDFVVMGYTTHYGMTSTYGSKNQGNALEQLSRTWDFIGTEIMSRNVYGCYRATQGYRKAKNQYRNSLGLPVFGLVYSSGPDWNVLYFGWALNNMNAQTTWEMSGFYCPEGLSNYRLFTVEKGNMNGKTAQPVADVALLFSNPSRDWPRMAAYPPDLFGTSQLLSARHIQHEFLNEMGLRPEVLKRFKVLCLNNVTALDDAGWAAVGDFVKAGGTLFLTGRTGAVDENGTTRELFLPAKFFPGLKLGNKALKSKEFSDGKQTWKVANPIAGAQFIWPKNKVPAGAEVLMTAQLGKRNDYPALVKTAYGKGTVYLTPFLFGVPAHSSEVTSGKAVTFVPQPDADELANAVLDKVGATRNVWNPVEVPAAVLTSVYRDGKDTMVHFLNATESKFKKGDVLPHILKENPYPQLEKDIVFEIPGTYRKVWAASPDFEKTELKGVTARNGVTRVTLPKKLLKTYTIVHLEQ